MTQLKRTSALTAAAGLGVLLGGAGMADATELQSFSVQHSSNASMTATFNRFDPSLGTLTQIEVELLGSTVGDGSSFSITGAEGGSSGSTGFGTNLQITDPSSTQLFAGSFGASSTCTVAGSAQNYADCSSGTIAPTDTMAAPGSFNPNPVDVPTSDWGSFVGAGLTVDLTAAILGFVAQTTVCNLGSYYYDGTCLAANDLSWSGTLSLTYDYIPVTAVPEPGGVALLLTGLAGLGWVGRRRLSGAAGGLQLQRTT